MTIWSVVSLAWYSPHAQLAAVCEASDTFAKCHFDAGLSYSSACGSITGTSGRLLPACPYAQPSLRGSGQERTENQGGAYISGSDGGLPQVCTLVVCHCCPLPHSMHAICS